MDEGKFILPRKKRKRSKGRKEATSEPAKVGKAEEEEPKRTKINRLMIADVLATCLGLLPNFYSFFNPGLFLILCIDFVLVEFQAI